MRDIVNEVAQMLTERGLTISVAEACTAGYVGHLLCAPAGASAYFWGGVIAYSGGSKRKLLGVSDELQQQYTSVSPEVALDMARKVREVMDTDIGISTSGVTGPGQGHSNRPLGFFYIGLATRDGHEHAQDFQWDGDRMSTKEQTAYAALEMVRDYVSQR